MERQQEQVAEAVALVIRWQDHRDQRARDRLLAGHLGIVGAVLRRYPGARRKDVFEDATIEGVLGLLHAIDQFDRTKSASFGMYAKLWVRAYILSFLQHGRMMRDSSRAGRRVFHNVGRAMRELHQQGIEATPTEIARVLGISEADCARALAALSDPASFDAPVLDGAGKPRPLGDLIPSDDAPADEQLDEIRERWRSDVKLHRALAQLPPRWRTVVEARYLREPPLSFRAAGALIGVCSERARQIQVEALERMRHALSGSYEDESEVA